MTRADGRGRVAGRGPEGVVDGRAQPDARRIAVVLAAGEGRRFGAVKQLAPLHGRPLLLHALGAMTSRAEIDETVVVLGAHAEAIRGALDLTGVTVVVCDDWARGPSASLAAGLAAAVRSGAVEVLITLGDQPALPDVTVDRVLARSGDVVRAVHGGRPGHPVLLRGAAIARMAGLDDDGRRAFLAAAATPVAVGDVDPGADVDRPEDLRALEAGGGQPANSAAIGSAKPGSADEVSDSDSRRSSSTSNAGAVADERR